MRKIYTQQFLGIEILLINRKCFLKYFLFFFYKKNDIFSICLNIFISNIYTTVQNLGLDFFLKVINTIIQKG